jgi:hypothetical protein
MFLKMIIQMIEHKDCWYVNLLSPREQPQPGVQINEILMDCQTPSIAV